MELDILEELDNLIDKYNIKWNEKDFEMISDDENGNPVEFYIYYQDPEYKNKIDLTEIMNRFNEGNFGKFKISEFILTKNKEFRIKFYDSTIHNQILFY